MNAPAPAPQETLIDPDAIDRFVDVVFGYLDGLVPVRMFSETGRQIANRTWPSTRSRNCRDN